MNKETPPGFFSKKSARSAGIFLILLSILFASASNRVTPILAAGIFPCGILFCLASTEFAQRWRIAPLLLVLAGMSSCAAISIVGLSKRPFIRESTVPMTRE